MMPSSIGATRTNPRIQICYIQPASQPASQPSGQTPSVLPNQPEWVSDESDPGESESSRFSDLSDFEDGTQSEGDILYESDPGESESSKFSDLSDFEDGTQSEGDTLY